MKTRSILMSSFGALLILISLSENALKSTDAVSKPNQVEAIEPAPVVIEAVSAIPATSASGNTIDLSYLKFNVSDFETVETSNDEMPEEADFSFLKFNVSEYTTTDVVELPEDSNFDYLKFDVNNYSSSFYNEELPQSKLSYLKFDLQKYIQSDSVGEINELPE